MLKAGETTICLFEYFEPWYNKVILLYLVGSLVTLLAYYPYTLVGSLAKEPPSCETPRQPTIYNRHFAFVYLLAKLDYSLYGQRNENLFTLN